MTYDKAHRLTELRHVDKQDKLISSYWFSVNILDTFWEEKWKAIALRLLNRILVKQEFFKIIGT
ncbi:hypothetical protein SORDD16_01841 [Streptococcus oralis]|uniref:Uncharacterized protein n=1 Tax=Streptococcus oralis TaxID=1303 RepID=A0A139P7V1_STROR|nr:hypothetical protein SORDD16_01841 [Streptococcus oralis]